MYTTKGKWRFSVCFCILVLLSFSQVVFGINFDGEAAMIELPVEISQKLEDAAGITLSAWAKRDPAGLNRKNVIMDITISETLSKAAFGFSADNTIAAGARTKPDGPYHAVATTSQWTDNKMRHIACVIDFESNEIKIYVDGFLQEIKGEYPAWGDVLQEQAGIRNIIGAGADAKNHFHGELHDIYVYNRALTESDIGILHVIGANIDENEIPSLVLYWKGSESLPDEDDRGKPLKSRVATPAVEELQMVEFSGSPRQTGEIWGEITRTEIRKSLEDFLKTVQNRSVSPETLMQFAQPGIDRVKEMAPHWLEDIRAIAEAADVDPDTYILFRFTSGLRGRPPRGLGWETGWEKEIEHECTTFAATGKGADNNGVFFHRT